MICLDANYLIGGRIVPFDSASAELAAGLFNLIGRPRARRVDVMIAAIAIQQDAQLATLNTEHFTTLLAHGLKMAVVPSR